MMMLQKNPHWTNFNITVGLKFRRKLKKRMCVLNIILVLSSNDTPLLFQPTFANFQIVSFVNQYI